MRHWLRQGRELHLNARDWSVAVAFYPKHVNFWFRFWLRRGVWPHYFGFLARLWFWLHEVWGVGWDIRERWESEYFMRFFYIEVNVEFFAKEK